MYTKFIVHNEYFKTKQKEYFSNIQLWIIVGKFKLTYQPNKNYLGHKKTEVIEFYSFLHYVLSYKRLIS